MKPEVAVRCGADGCGRRVAVVCRRRGGDVIIVRRRRERVPSLGWFEWDVRTAITSTGQYVVTCRRHGDVLVAGRWLCEAVAEHERTGRRVKLPLP